MPDHLPYPQVPVARILSFVLAGVVRKWTILDWHEALVPDAPGGTLPLASVVPTPSLALPRALWPGW